MRIERLTENQEPKWTLTRFRSLNPNGVSVLVLPGGGYQNLATGHEGEDIGVWLNARGYDAWMLEYRVASDANQPPLGGKPLEDAREALEHVRKGEVVGLQAFGENGRGLAVTGTDAPRKIGVWGFSAGGHLAATLATEPGTHLDFAVLAYPVISLEEGYTHGGSRRNLLGDSPEAELVHSLSAHNRVTKDTPPTFIFHTSDDAAVPVENAILFYSALRKHEVPAELHIYETGRHGVGLAPDDATLRTWVDRLEDWLTRRSAE